MTSKWNGFKGEARRIEDLDIPRIGAKIQVGEDELHAFMDVEAAGSGFDSKGRPKMLFEPHVFYRELTGKQRDEAVAAGLAYSKWGAKPYPKDSYPRLLRAIEINETAALRSASWGLGQILGTNHKLVGYATPQAMVTRFMDDEEAHLEAIVEFLIGNNIGDDLKAHRWAVVARVYNGPGYAKHNYHTRMAKAYEKWSKIGDTPWSPEKESEMAAKKDSPAVGTPKPWWKSLGVMGPVTAIAALALGRLGIEVTGADIEEVIKLATEGVAIGGAVIGIIGRIRAKKPVG